MLKKQYFKYFKIFIITISVFIFASCENQKINETVNSEIHNVNLKKAKVVALSIFNEKNNPTSRETTVTKTIQNVIYFKISDENSVNAFYVFNYLEGGFSIISADDRISPVLAYSEEGNFSAETTEIPEPVQSWIEQEKEISQNVKVQNLEQTPDVKLEWDSALDRLPPVDSDGGGDGGDGGTGGNDWCTDYTYQKNPLVNSAWDQCGV